MSKNRDIADILGKTETANTNNAAIRAITDNVGLDVYATLDDLPTTGLTSGDQAFVTATNRLYVSNGSGWYNVALFNATPTLSISPIGAVTLAVDGSTPTVITLTGTDSDNADANLTYTVESDGSFADIATLSQDSSVFTITPLAEGSATPGSSTLTFKVSDGISFASGTTEFSLTFGATYSNLLNSTDYALGTTGGTFNASVKKQGTHSLYIVGNAVTSRNPGANSGSAVTYNDWTISFWFYIQSFFNYNGTPHVHLFNCNDKYQGNNGYSFGTKGNLITSNDTYWLASDGYNGSSYGGMTGNTGTNWVTGAWYHLVFSGSTTGPTIGAWITKEGQSFGNILSRETFGGHSAITTRVTALKIGGTDGLYLHGSYGTASDGGNVYYDDFRIYNAKASSSDAQAIFNSAGDVTLGSNPLQSNLKLAYTFDNTANSIS
jgi:hypothetical protein